MLKKIFLNNIVFKDFIKNTSKTPEYILYLIIFLTIFYSYFGLWNTFFVADVWHMLASQILIPDYGISYLFQLFAIPHGIHFTPLGIVLSSVQTALFETSIPGYAIVSISLHYTNSLILFNIVKKLSDRKLFAFLSAIFFATNFQIREGVFWFASNIWTQTSTALTLISIYLLIRFIQTKKLRIYIVSLILINLAVYFREYAFMILFVNIFVLIYVMLKSKLKVHNFFNAMFLSIFSIGFYVFLRMFVVTTTSAQIVKPSALLSTNVIALSLWNIFTFPARILSSALIPERTVLIISEKIAKYIYFQIPIAQTDVFTTVLFFDQLNIFVGSIFLIVIFFIFVTVWKKNLVHKLPLMVIGLSFLIIPVVFISFGDYRYWIFSRYLYMPHAIFSIFIFVLFAQFKLFKKFNIVSFFLLISILSYIVVNMYLTNRFIASFVEVGQQRQEILQYISSRLDFEKEHQIIYITNSKIINSGIDGTLPFQSNSGKIIFTWSYYQGNNRQLIPRCLADPQFLYLKFNEYKYCNGKGYGYFQNFSELEKLISNRDIDPEYIKAFYYNEENKIIEDISQKIKEKLQTKVNQ